VLDKGTGMWAVTPTRVAATTRGLHVEVSLLRRPCHGERRIERARAGNEKREKLARATTASCPRAFPVSDGALPPGGNQKLGPVLRGHWRGRAADREGFAR
jgi:hypothetical protein